ncbi:hypothetical protein Hanom_Chr16g01446491 [Helianthus anomalus]
MITNITIRIFKYPITNNSGHDPVLQNITKYGILFLVYDSQSLVYKTQIIAPKSNPFDRIIELS